MKTLKHKIEQFREEFSPFVIQGKGLEMEMFIFSLVKDALEACRVKKVKFNVPKEVKNNTIKTIEGDTLYPGVALEKTMNNLLNESFNKCTTQYDDNVKRFLEEK